MVRPITPALTADSIVELLDQPGRPIVLIERRHPPNGWALPGGFVEVGETLEQAAVREAKEETGLQVTLKTLLGVYSDPLRDPRGHTVTAVYVAEAYGVPRAGDDAGKAQAFDPLHLPALVFDHGLILGDYRRYREMGMLTPLRL
jgi:8-oxo-dGTP diphosphatase